MSVNDILVFTFRNVHFTFYSSSSVRRISRPAFVQALARKLTIFIEVRHGFPLSLKANTWRSLKLSHAPLPSVYFLIKFSLIILSFYTDSESKYTKI
jgi:hypothetical protein